MDENLSTVNAGQEGNVDLQPQVDTEPVNAGTEETASPSVNKPVQSAEENAKYAAIRREAEQKARDKARDELVAEMYGDSHGIRTYADYKKAVDEAKRQEEIDRLVQQNIPQEYAEKLLKVDELERWKQDQEKAKEEEAKAKENESKAYQEKLDFLDYFKEVNGHEFDGNADKIPSQVFINANKFNVPLKFAYAEYLANDYRSKLTGVDQGKKTAEVNRTNSNSSPGSVNGNGQAAGFVTESDLEAHANDTAWMMKNYDKVEKFYAKKGR